MGLLHPGRDIRRPNSYKSASFVADVINNDDSKHPDGKTRQRVQFRIAQGHRNIPDSDLPYASQIPGGQQNAGAGVGAVKVPPNGAKVFVRYEDGDPHLPYYVSSPIQDDVHQDNETLTKDYPNTYGQTDQAGNIVETNTEKNTITDTHVSGSTFMRDAEGNVHIFAPGKIYLGATGGIEIASPAEIKIHASGNTSIKGAQAHINSSDAAVSATPVGARTRPSIPDKSGQTTL